jgi:hypothetical protein
MGFIISGDLKLGWPGGKLYFYGAIIIGLYSILESCAGDFKFKVECLK